MDKWISLLKLLKNHEFLSGQSLAERLSVSRTTIANWVAELNKNGIEINSVKRRGYRLVTKIDFLSRVSVLTKISPRHKSKLNVIDILSETDSTNTVCSKYGYREGDWKLVATEFQTSGRGRRGNVWTSDPFQNLLFSLGHCAVFPNKVLFCLSILAGLSLAKTLKTFFVNNDGPEFKIKWPNDIYLGDEKICGILCELRGSPQDEAVVVIGVGINVNKSPVIPDYPTTNLNRSFPDVAIDRSVLLGAVVDDLIETFESAKESGIDQFLSSWDGFDYLRGRDVLVSKGDSKVSGVAMGIDPEGQLVVESGDGKILSFNGGEVSVRWL